MRRARRSGLTFGYALATSLSSLFPSLGARSKDEYVGASPCFLPLVRKDRPDVEMLLSGTVYIIGHCRPRMFPNHHCVDSPRSAGLHIRVILGANVHRGMFFSLRGSQWISLASALPHVCNALSVRCVESRIVRGDPAMVRGACELCPT